MTQTLRIDFISDVACPWCVIGLRGLLKALDAVGEGAEIEFHLQPFELNPDMGPEGENTTEHIARKYGSSPERSVAAREAIRQGGEAVGFAFNYGPESRIWNTFDAHRLLHWAAEQGQALALKQALFKLYFTDQRSTSDHAALLDAVREAGLDAARAAQILSSDEFTQDVREEQMRWRSNGINAVPSVIFNQRWLIQGAQPPQVYEQAMRDILSGKAREAEA
ncbi:MAG: DsbA family oxidoreductase [Hyphomonadaceae bacterium]